MEKRTYKYSDNVVQIDAALTPQQVKENWASIYPELLHAQIVELADGSVEFVEVAGQKGL